MEVAIRKMGNSQGILIPKPILAQIGLEGSADLQVRDGVIEIRPIHRNPREGWADDAGPVARIRFRGRGGGQRGRDGPAPDYGAAG